MLSDLGQVPSVTLRDNPTVPVDHENPRSPSHNGVIHGLGGCDEDRPFSLTHVVRRQGTPRDGNDPMPLVCIALKPAGPKGCSVARVDTVRVEDQEERKLPRVKL